MLQKVLNLTNDAGRKFVNTWIINGPKCYGVQNIIKMLPEDGNFFYIVVKPVKGGNCYTVSLPNLETDCLPTFFGSVAHLEKTIGVKLNLDI